jgi:hypothetical protein
VVESSRKWPESGLVVQMPCSPVTLCRDLRTALEPLCLGVGILTYTRQMAHETAEAIIAFVSSLRPDHLEAF